MKCLHMGWWLSPVRSGQVGSGGSGALCGVLVLALALAHPWAVESLGGLLAGLESETKASLMELFLSEGAFCLS